MAEDGGQRSFKQSKEDRFFAQKKDWSRTKDRVVGAYLVPYLEKVKLRPAPILLIDPFAGPGKFAADGAPGSPLQITQIAQRIVPGRYKAIFGNKRLRSHQKLTSTLSDLIKRKAVQTHLLEADALLMELGAKLGRATVFLYLDPFGLPPAFPKLKPFLERQASTEILLNLPPSAIARQAAMGPMTAQIYALHNRLTQVLGSEYWRAVFERTDITQDQKLERVIRDYVARIKKHLPYSGSCPIRQREGSAIKYHMTFFSGHSDAPVIYNDLMRKAYREGLYYAMTKGTLLEGAEELVDNQPREIDALKELVVEMLRSGGRESRLQLWREIVDAHFMEFGSSNYIKAVRILREEQRIAFEDVKGTGKLNDYAVLYVQKSAAGRTPAPAVVPPSPMPGPSPKGVPMPPQIDVALREVRLRAPAPLPRPKPEGE
jgi:three-Cys-motif partner protein